MLKAIRLKIFQQMPNYRKPASFAIKESFPLPPYSTVIGMVHSVCDFKEYHPMRVSIQGNHASDLADIETQYVFGETYNEKECSSNPNYYKIPNKSNPKGDKLIKGTKSIQFLTDVELYIHIVPDNPEDLETIYNGLLNPREYISLGRREDIARVDEVEKVDLQKVSADDIFSMDTDVVTKYSAYCPFAYIQDASHGDMFGTIYKIPKVFNTNTKSNRRNWQEIIPVRYIPKNIGVNFEVLTNENVFLDDDIPVFFA